MPKVRLNKKDIYRALLTETTPGDVPIIFSNDGLYINSHGYRLGHESTGHEIFKSFYEKIFFAGNSQSNPYKYSIKKGEFSLRGLSLIHPRAQFNFTNFYNNYSDAIIYLCSLSQATIRTPYKVCNSYYRKDIDKASKYKEIDIDTLENELFRKHASSFFSYRGYNRLYKLFDSNVYVLLEKKFSSFWMLDVANCFDSVYTHTISWAIKNKDYIKNNIQYRNQFCNEFDQLVQRSNNNETNGIPIGSEISRIFAEIIFQVIDCNIISALSDAYDYSFDKEYVFYRYVDDYVIFSESENISSRIAKTISDCLSEYNLYVNEGKLKKYVRPFNTEKSNVIGQTKLKILEFEEKILEKSKLNEKRLIRPRKINRKDSLIKYFIGQIKYVCRLDSKGYEDVSSYLISTFSKRIIELIDGYNRLQNKIDDEETLKYRDVIMILLRLMFFFYTVNPQVSSSYKLAKTVVIIDRFLISSCPEFIDHFRTQIMKEISHISFTQGIDAERSGFVFLESLNILLATSEFGINYLIDEDKLKTFIYETSEISYFSLVSLLYYIKDHQIYSKIKSVVESKILQKLGRCKNIAKDSEVAHLFLDSLSCPYISHSTRSKILSSYLSEIEPDMNLDSVELDQTLDKLQATYWFVKWVDLDLIKLLERKELINSY